MFKYLYRGDGLAPYKVQFKWSVKMEAGEEVYGLVNTELSC